MAENNYVHLLTTTKVSYPSLNSLKRGGLSSKLHVFSVFYNMPLYLPLYAVSFMRLSAFNPYIYFITNAYSASLILIFTSVLLCRHTPESRTQSFHPSVLLRRSVSKGRKVPTPLPQSPRPGQDADGFS